MGKGQIGGRLEKVEGKDEEEGGGDELLEEGREEEKT